MPLKHVVLWKRRAAAKVSVLALFAQSMMPAIAAAQDNSTKTTTPIKHVIVIKEGRVGGQSVIQSHHQ
jgi:hypothetical protein